MRGPIATFFCGLGEGAEAGIQGLSSSFVSHGQHSRLFTTVTNVEMIARALGGQWMAVNFRSGRNAGGFPNGYAFLTSSVRHYHRRHDYRLIYSDCLSRLCSCSMVGQT